MKRKSTSAANIGRIVIGNYNKIAIQSMTTTNTKDVVKTIEQIKSLEDIGCEIIRVAVPDKDAAVSIREIKKNINIPIVADIHFNQSLAIMSLENGADKIRINPGNIGGLEKCIPIINKANENGAAIRIGVNSGSLDPKYYKKYGKATAEALTESALEYVEFFKKQKFFNMVVSLKSSNVIETIEATRMFSEKSDIPIHLGVTEAGTKYAGTIKSAVGIGTLLAEGIGDTLRVSLTGDPKEEIKVAKEILKSLNLYKKGLEIISCPTCGRCQIDLSKIAESFEKKSSKFAEKDLKIAIMGCAVNGPGEAKEADIGIAGGKGEAILFKKGKVLRKIKEEDIVDILMEEIENS
jgi:(E)-4-hydroxy-3-methylbut-2-enyl-diphosphate synthase